MKSLSMDLDALFGKDFDLPNPTPAAAPKADKPRVTVAEFQAYHAGHDTKCPKCANSPKPGYWWFRAMKSWAPCARCAGTGQVSAVDQERFVAYNERKDSGEVMDTSYKTHAAEMEAAYARIDAAIAG